MAVGVSGRRRGGIPDRAIRGVRRRPAGSMPNRRKKLALVAAAIVSTGTPRSRAISTATCGTNDGSLVLPRWGTGARYGESVSISMRSSGTFAATSFSAVALRKVTMPENEMWKPRSSAACATSQVSVKQCITPPASSARSSRMIASVSSAAARVWITSGRPDSRPARMCRRKRARCHSRSPPRR